MPTARRAKGDYASGAHRLLFLSCYIDHPMSRLLQNPSSERGARDPIVISSIISAPVIDKTQRCPNNP